MRINECALYATLQLLLVACSATAAGKAALHTDGGPAADATMDASKVSTRADGGPVASAVADAAWPLRAGDASLVDAAHAGASAGTGGVDGADSGPLDDAGVCTSVALTSDIAPQSHPANLLVMFDRSASMTTAWDTSTRWQAAGDALVSALSLRQNQLTLGALFFPSDQAVVSCVVEPIAAADQIAFAAGTVALAKMQTGGMSGMPMFQPGIGQTPTSEAIAAADAALAGAVLTGPSAALIITDGEPNCMWDATSSQAVLTAWASQKQIKTFVVGLPGVSGNGPMVLDALAQAGGTGTASVPADHVALRAKLSEIVGTVLRAAPVSSCMLQLTAPALPTSDVHLVVTVGGAAYDAPRTFAGQLQPAWSISADGKTVRLLGALCTKAQGPGYEQVALRLGCVALPLLSLP